MQISLFQLSPRNQTCKCFRETVKYKRYGKYEPFVEKFLWNFFYFSAVSKESDLQVLEGAIEIGSQYHFYLEPVACIVRPIEDDQVLFYLFI